MTKEQEIASASAISFDGHYMLESIKALGYSNCEEYKRVALAFKPKDVSSYEILRKFFKDSSTEEDEQQQQLLQEILDKVDNTLTTTNYVPGSRVKTLEDLNAFLEYIIPFWISMQQALRNTDALQNNGII